MNALYLIRHSITEGIERGLYYGATDLPIVESGVKLCESLRGSYDIPTDVVYATTGMLRTEQTLYHLFGDMEHEVLPDLREMHLGNLEMHSYEELKDNADYQTWIFDEVGDFHLPGGAESKNEMSERILRCINMLKDRPGPDMVVICHGGTICNAMTNLFPTARAHFYEWSPKACHGYVIFFKDGRPDSFKEL